MNVVIEEEERQAILLALFKLKRERPGWDGFIQGIERKFGGQTDWPEASAYCITAAQELLDSSRGQEESEP